MRRHSTLSLLVLALMLSSIGCASTYEGANASSQVTASASVGVQFDNLSAYGRWIDTDSYGTAWVPIGVSAGWRPYTVGYWTYTDWGWMWASADPWGWVPYHYGQWGYDASYGWVWVPGDVWAPAWVAWRYGDGWAGWAPLPPDIGWNGTVAFSYNSYDDSRIEQSGWCFAPARALTTTRLTTQIVPPGRNVTLISVTHNVTNYQVVNSHPVERGLRPDMIERDTGRRIQHYQVVETTSPRGSSGLAFRGQTVQVTRPSNQSIQQAKGHLREIASDRAVTPPPRNLYQRQEAEAQRMDQQMKRQRDALARQQAQELRKPPRGMSRDELVRRHDAEMKAQQQSEERERQAVNQRRELMKNQMEQRESQRDSKDSKDSKEKQQREHGNGKGKGRPDRS
jgi:hypothetical protein